MLRHLPKTAADPNLLVGLDTSDDAGVYKISEDLALIQTVDYFTPIVDDPYMFGQIAAANALSDVYAMGGRPLTVLNIVGFPVKKLGMSILADILRGAADKVAEAGAVIVGGHSIDDQEPKFGLAVTGTVHPERILPNNQSKPGDVLILTKPIGIGIQTQAIKKDLLSEEEMERVMSVMATLNKTAAEVMESYPVHSCTDITGFGLLGHTKEMAAGSQVGIVIQNHQVPVLPRSLSLAKEGVIPGGSKSNHHWLENCVTYDSSLSLEEQLILCDAVTSGGLLISLPEKEGESLLQSLKNKGISEAAIIGHVVSDHPGCIIVEK